jgi:hypothetical protein
LYRGTGKSLAHHAIPRLGYSSFLRKLVGGAALAGQRRSGESKFQAGESTSMLLSGSFGLQPLALDRKRSSSTLAETGLIFSRSASYDRIVKLVIWRI